MVAPHRRLPVSRFALISASLVASYSMATPTFAAEPALVNLAESIQELNSENVRVELNLAAAFADRDKQHNLSIRADWSQGQAGTSRVNARTPESGSHQSTINTIRYDGETIYGEMAITLMPDKWVPEDQKPVPLTVEFNGKVRHLFGPNEQQFTADHWNNPDKRSGKLAIVEGSYILKSERFGASTGTLNGSLRLPNASGKWNIGQKHADGVHVGFNMGNKRVNWNQMRNTRLNFAEPKDLRSFGGLRVGISTEQPRSDAAVSVWLKEADGSWYYYSRAVPLNLKENSAEIYFSDFEEAEWVSPDGGTSFMDEDYALDLSQVTAVAVGVVNAFGIGPVTFAIQELSLLPKSPVKEVR